MIWNYKTKAEGEAVLIKLIAPLTIWALSQLFKVPRIEKSASRFDRKAREQGERAMKSLREAKRTARSNPGLLAASAAAFALGIGLMTKAAKRR
jgi:hypothetical protein